jgi:hypothetical protein
MRWPRSKVTQSVIASILGLLAAVNEWLQIAADSFNNFYFGPHKAYPYPYPDAHSAQLAMYWKCGLAFGLVFIVTFALLAVIASRKRKGAET